ncbi:MAG: hypothetical protein EA396_12125 [Anaerolineaceae bacterium]|nr:MAG: hypothetical protein EA396_12125 [Anaerolineaceae bacterium]
MTRLSLEIMIQALYEQLRRPFADCFALMQGDGDSIRAIIIRRADAKRGYFNRKLVIRRAILGDGDPRSFRIDDHQIECQTLCDIVIDAN